MKNPTQQPTTIARGVAHGSTANVVLQAIVDGRRIRTAASLNEVARFLREVSRGTGPVAQVLADAAVRVERASTFVVDVPPEAAIARMRELARQKPEWFLGGALLLGVFAGRFFKSTASEASITEE